MKSFIALALLLSTSAAQAKTFSKFDCRFDVSINGKYESFPMESRPWADGSAGYVYYRPGTGIMIMATQWLWKMEAMELSMKLGDESVQATASIRENGYVETLILTKAKPNDESYSVRCQGLE